MRGIAWAGVVAGVGIGFTTFLTVLSTVGLANANEPEPPASPTAEVTAAAAPATGGLTVVAKDLAFKPTELTAAPGEATIVLDNEDKVPHNLHLFEGRDASGTSVGSTEIKTGPGNESLKVTLAAGTYFFQCDVHPTQMKGTLTVKAGS